MDNKNPIFSRLDQQTTGGSGFAYAEGRAAYDQAGRSPFPPVQTGVPVGAPQGSVYEPITDRMTIDDVLIRTGMTLAVLIPMAFVGWVTAPAMPMLFVGAMVVGLVLGLVNSFKRQVSPALVLLYAAAEGLFLGGISYAYDVWAQSIGYQGLVSQAVMGTLVAFVVMLALYKSRLVKVNGRFQRIMLVAMVSYLVIAMASFVSALFGVGGGWGFYGVGALGILLAVAGVGLAAFSLMLDFESITRGIQAGLPSRESWRMSFGLLVTLIWLYLEILRLLAIIAASSRN